MKHSLVIFGPSGSVELTVREFAQMERVTTRTVRNWIQKGAVEYRRTAGGRVRILQSMKNAETRGNLSR